MAESFQAEDDDRTGVPDGTVLYRRVDWDKIGGSEKCPPGQEAKLNDNCFTDYPKEKALELGYPAPCMSVGADFLLLEQGKKPQDMLEGYEGYGLAKVTARELRGLETHNGTPCPQGIKRSPTNGEPWHCVVFDLSGRRSGAAKKAIARAATWEIPLIGGE